MLHTLFYIILIHLLIVVTVNRLWILAHRYLYCHAEYSTYDLGFFIIKILHPAFIKEQNIIHIDFFFKLSFSRGKNLT